MKRLAWLVALIIATATLLTFSWSRTGEKLKASTESIERSNSALRLRLKEKSGTLASIQSQRDGLRRALDDINTTQKMEEASSPSPVAVMLQDDPEILSLHEKSRRVTLQPKYAAFFRMLQMTPDAVEKFKDLAVLRAEQRDDFNIAAGKAGLSVNSEDRKTALARIDEEYFSAQKTLLGNAGAQELAQFERTLPARELVSNIAGPATLAGASFSPSQMEALVSVIVDADPSYHQGSSVDLKSVDWDTVDTRAKGILTPEQFAAFSSVEVAGGLGMEGSAGRRYYQFIHAAEEAVKADAASQPQNKP